MKRQCADGAWRHAGYARMKPAKNSTCAGFISEIIVNQAEIAGLQRISTAC
jgi:hypothetical protein